MCLDHPPHLWKVSQVPGLLGSRPSSREKRLTSHRPSWLEGRVLCLSVHRPYTHTGRGTTGHVLAEEHASGPHHSPGSFVKNAETARPLHAFVPFQLILLFCLNHYSKHQTRTRTWFEETELVTKLTAPATWPRSSLPKPSAHSVCICHRI